MEDRWNIPPLPQLISIIVWFGASPSLFTVHFEHSSEAYIASLLDLTRKPMHFAVTNLWNEDNNSKAFGRSLHILLQLFDNPLLHSWFDTKYVFMEHKWNIPSMTLNVRIFSWCHHPIILDMKGIAQGKMEVLRAVMQMSNAP